MLARYISLMFFIGLAIGSTSSMATSSTPNEQNLRRASLLKKIHMKPVSHPSTPSENHVHRASLLKKIHTDHVSNHFKAYGPPPPIQIKDDMRHVPAFTQVNIEGPFNVRLHTNKKQKPSVMVHGDAMDLIRIQTRVIKHVLYVSIYEKREHFASKPHLRLGYADLDINIPNFHRFMYQGQGTITAHKIHASPIDISINNNKNSTWSGRLGLRYLTLTGKGNTNINGVNSHNLNVTLEDSPHVILRGEANLRRLSTQGDGWLNFYWVKGGRVVVRSKGSTRVSLAGSVELLEACFSGKTRFDGRYLRAKESFIKTNDEAIAEISTVGDQHTLARGVSDIYYYNHPERQTDYMARNAAVLDMRPEGLKLVQSDRLYDH